MSQRPSDLQQAPRQPESETISNQRRRQAIEQRLREQVDGARDATVREREPGVFEAEVETRSGERVRRTFRFGQARKTHRKEEIAQDTPGVESDDIRFEDGEAVLTKEAVEEQRERAVEAATERAVRQALEDAPPGVSREDLQVRQVDGEVVVTAPERAVQQGEQPTRRPSERAQPTKQESDEQLRERLRERVQKQTPFSAIPGTDFEITQAAGGALAASLTQSGRRKAARKQLEERLESRFGIDVTPGKEFEVSQAEGGGFVPELTLTGKRRIGQARRLEDASLLTSPSQVQQGAEFATVSPREVGAARRRQDASLLSPPSQAEQGVKFNRVSGREIAAARRRENPDNLTPDSQVEQGLIDVVSRRELGAARRRENPELLSPRSQVEQGLQFQPLSTREIGAQRRRQDPDALTPPSEQAQTTDREVGAAIRRADPDALTPESEVAQRGARELRQAAPSGDPLVIAGGQQSLDQLSTARRAKIRQGLEDQLEQQTGAELEAGEDFVLQQEGGQISARLTDQGEVEVAAAGESGQTELDKFIEQAEAETGVDVIPGDGDVVQSVTEGLTRAATTQRQGRGLIPSGEQFGERSARAFDVLPFGAARGGEGDETFARGIGERLGEFANPAAIALGAQQLGESAGEFGFNILASDTAPTQEQQREFGERAIGQTAAAGAAGGALFSSTVESVQQRPIQTAGSAATEGALLGASTLASPVRVRSATFPLQKGASTTVRGLRLETPPLARGVLGRRGRTVVGQRGLRVSRGAPEVPLEEIDFSDIGFRESRAFEPTGVLETESLTKSARRQLADEQVRRLEAATGLQDVGVEGTTRGALEISRTEDIVAEARDVPAGTEAGIAEALEDLDATIKGSAAVRAQLGRRARKPRDVDLIVDDKAAAKTRLQEPLAGVEESPGDVFDFAVREEVPAPGEPLKFGRPRREPIETEEGVRLNPVEEELTRKSVAFFREPGAAGTPKFDIGPGPVAPNEPAARLKDIQDASAIGQELIEQRFRDTSTLRPLQRRRLRQQAESLEEFRSVFNEDLLQEQFAPFQRGVADTERQRTPLFGRTDRAQVTLVDLIPARGARGAVDTGTDTPKVADVQDVGDASPRGRATEGGGVGGAPILAPSTTTERFASAATTQPSESILPSPTADATRASTDRVAPLTLPSPAVSDGVDDVLTGAPAGNTSSPRITTTESPSAGIAGVDLSAVSPQTGSRAERGQQSPAGAPSGDSDPSAVSVGGASEPRSPAVGAQISDVSPALDTQPQTDNPTGFVTPDTVLSPGSPGSPSGGGGFARAQTGRSPFGFGFTAGLPGSNKPFRLRGEDEERRRQREPEPNSGDRGTPDSFLAPGFLSETFRDIATLGGPARDVEQETLEEAATQRQLLTGEVPTGTELFGDEETQAEFEAVGDLLSPGVADDDAEEVPLL